MVKRSVTASLTTMISDPGSILGAPMNFYPDVAELYWRHCLEQWTEA